MSRLNSLFTLGLRWRDDEVWRCLLLVFPVSSIDDRGILRGVLVAVGPHGPVLVSTDQQVSVVADRLLGSSWPGFDDTLCRDHAGKSSKLAANSGRQALTVYSCGHGGIVVANHHSTIATYLRTSKWLPLTPSSCSAAGVTGSRTSGRGSDPLVYQSGRCLRNRSGRRCTRSPSVSFPSRRGRRRLGPGAP